MTIIVISYNMNRELPRTIYSLSAEYQRDISRDDYEVIIIDNGSKIPPRMEDFAGIDVDLSIYSYENPTHSPVAAINMGLNIASGQFIGVCIDGARIHSPRVLATAREGLSMQDRSVVAVRGRYLGSEMQRDSMAKGYDKAAEDLLLSSAAWQTYGYRLFDISVFDESSGPTWFHPICESNALFMGRSLWHELNGFDPQFKSPGGGLVNLDTWKRATQLPNVNPLILFGEATFHQVHGGVATNGNLDTISTFFDEYLDIRGVEYTAPQVEVALLGKIHYGFHPGEGFANKNNAKVLKRKSLFARFMRFMGQRLSSKSKRSLRDFYDLLEAIIHRHPFQGIRQLRLEKYLAGILEAHPLFDSKWYEMTYPHVSAAGYRPSLHYVRHGVFQRTEPGPIFDAKWYLDHYPDLRDSGENPLIHYLLHGENEGRRVHINSQSFAAYERPDEQELRQILINSPLFDSDWYLEQYPDVSLSGLNPEIDYLRFGVLLRRNPSQNFDGLLYRREYLDVQKSGINPLVHFEMRGRAEGRSYHPVSGSQREK